MLKSGEKGALLEKCTSNIEEVSEIKTENIPSLNTKEIYAISPKDASASTNKEDLSKMDREDASISLSCKRKKSAVLGEELWEELHLTESFRVPSVICEFISSAMMRRPGAIRSAKKKCAEVAFERIIETSNGEVTYISRDLRDAEKVARWLFDLVRLYGEKNVVVLSPTIRGNEKLIAVVNTLSLRHKVRVHITIKDDDDGEEIEAVGPTLRVTSIHSAKGCEWPVVVYFGFGERYGDKHPPIRKSYVSTEYTESNDSSGYFPLEEMDSCGSESDADRTASHSCPNLDYVAATRASQHLILLRHCHDALPKYLDLSHSVFQKSTCLECLQVECRCSISACSKCRRQKMACECVCTHKNCLPKECKTQISVTTLLNYAPCDAILDSSGLQYVEGKGMVDELPIPELFRSVLADGTIVFDHVRDVVGVAIPAMHEFSTTGKVKSIYNPLTPWPSEMPAVMTQYRPADEPTNSRLRILRRMSVTPEYDGTASTFSDLLYACANYLALRNSLDARVENLQPYNWFPYEHGRKTCDNVDSVLRALDADYSTLFYDRLVTVKMPDGKRTLAGKIDLVGFTKDRSTSIVVELKYKYKLDTRDILQTALYSYMLEKETKNSTPYIRAILLNMRTGDWVDVRTVCPSSDDGQATRILSKSDPGFLIFNQLCSWHDFPHVCPTPGSFETSPNARNNEKTTKFHSERSKRDPQNAPKHEDEHKVEVMTQETHSQDSRASDQIPFQESMLESMMAILKPDRLRQLFPNPNDLSLFLSPNPDSDSLFHFESFLNNMED